MAWFTINLTGLVADSTIRPKYGLLNVSAATGMVASEMYNYSSNDTPLRGELETLKADYEQFKFSSSTAPPNEVDLVMFMGQSNMAGRGTASQAPKVPITAGYEFRAISDPTMLYQIVDPFGVNENNAAGINEPGMKTGSMVPAFVNAYYNCWCIGFKRRFIHNTMVTEWGFP